MRTEDYLAIQIDYLVNRDKPRSKSTKPLPEAHTLVAPCNLPTPPPPVTSPMIPNDILIQADTAEGDWLDKLYVCQKKMK